jgi:hypothetical protein
MAPLVSPGRGLPRTKKRFSLITPLGRAPTGGRSCPALRLDHPAQSLPRPPALTDLTTYHSIAESLAEALLVDFNVELPNSRRSRISGSSKDRFLIDSNIELHKSH